MVAARVRVCWLRARARCVGERILWQKLQCETLRPAPRLHGEVVKRRFRAGRPKIVLLRLPYINTAACHLARTAVGTFRYKSLALALRGRERARLRRARRDDRDGGIGCLVRATEGDRATAQGLLGLREFSPSARACRPNMIARPCRPEHLLFY